ncbi:MAG: hypothetical protein Q8Q31_02850 [Nanoarchaeota archaeon]|nr:hypothetical protein [Nanoarchaeota archaeon]
MKTISLGNIKGLEYSLITEASAEETMNAPLVTLPQFFAVYSELITKNPDFFWGNSEICEGRFYTSTTIRIEQQGIRVRPDRNFQSEEGWGELVIYPWERILFASLRTKVSRAKLEKHPIVKPLFHHDVKGLYCFGRQYSPKRLDIPFEGVENEGDYRYGSANVDMTYDDGNDPAIIEIGFDDLPLRKDPRFQFNGKGIIINF